jgi:hypothetical protein
MKDKESITLRINKSTREKYEQLFPSKTEGITEAAERFLSFQRYALKELKGKFNRQELIAILDAFNGLIQENEYMPVVDMFIAELEDHEKYNNMSNRFGIDYNDFIPKTKSLTSAQAYFFLMEIRRFWDLDDKAYQDENGRNDLEKFVEFFIS